MAQVTIQPRTKDDSKVGSIGAAWPPALDKHNARVKGFAQFKIDDRPTLVRMLNEATEVRRAHLSLETRKPKATRITVRAFIRKDVLEESVTGVESPISGEGQIKVVKVKPDFSTEAPDFRVEAVIDAERVFPGYQLVYFGFNETRRLPRSESLTAELDIARRVSHSFRARRVGYDLKARRVSQGLQGRTETALARLDPRGYQRMIEIDREAVLARLDTGGYGMVQLNGQHTQQDVAQLAALYARTYQMYTFDINRASLEAMFTNGNMIMVGRHLPTGDIVSSLIAEHCRIEVDGVPVHLYESSDWATHSDHRGHGLITAMQIEATRMIRELAHGERSIIYAEVRAPWEPANRSAASAGMEWVGTLLKHCVIKSDRDVEVRGNREDLNVWVAP